MGNPLGHLAVAPLDAGRAKDAAVTGAKAANLARSAVARLPVLPGCVLVPGGRLPNVPLGVEAVRSAWHLLGGDGRALVVRSSSAHEDTEDSSLAERFDSVLDVRDWEAFQDAVRTVPESARRVQPPRPPKDAPPDDGMAVLVQPMLRAAVGGVAASRTRARIGPVPWCSGRGRRSRGTDAWGGMERPAAGGS